MTFDRDSIITKNEIIHDHIDTKIFIKEVAFDGDTPIPHRKMKVNLYQRIKHDFHIQDVESEEDPSFDEEPINVELPEVINVVESA